MRLDTDARTATLSTKEVVGYDVALLATGANVRRLRLEGGQLDGVHYLRALGNADAIRADAEQAEHVVLVGGSYIACEVAATLTSLGRACTMVMLEDAPLAAHFGPTAGGFFADLLRGHGVELVCGDGVERLEGGERVERVVTASGRELPADMVVMGTGAVPDVMLARSAKLELGESGGVRCSPTLATSAPGVWAAGDMCEYDSVLHGRPRPDRALRGRAGPGQGRRRGDARERCAVRRGALLLDRPRRLVHGRVGRRDRGARSASSCGARSPTARSRSSISPATGSSPR